ncbi:MAG: hypothetical protein J0J04_07650 [Microbacterium sp.]|uniref:hypothetical protein n=1 Tax=Microbacterium sp. TaxID=51671 RepID=UPI001AD548B1|nr:hypothetical protein [Microbacterium sp.]MBN9214672.1 hypothetical protein [Microbacterium sp.]
MTIDAFGNRHDRAGRFAGVVNDAPAGHLAVTAPLRDEAEDALEAYELREEDLPGIRAAWEERFAPLDQPMPEPVFTAAGEILGIPDDTGFEDAAIVADHGDRIILECRYEYPSDIPGVEFELDEDGTPLPARATVTDADAMSRLRKAEEGAPMRRTLGHLRVDRTSYQRGWLPVWHLTADPAELAAADVARRTARGADEQKRARKAWWATGWPGSPEHVPAPIDPAASFGGRA